MATIYSVTWEVRAGQPGGEFWAQVYTLPVALAAMLACMMVDYRTLAQRSLFIYGGLLLLLIYVAFFGVVAEGPVDGSPCRGLRSGHPSSPAWP